MLSQHPDLLAEELSNFIGSENYYKHLGGLHYTDGVKYLAENVEAYWLIDLIMGYQSRVFRAVNEFQVWTLQPHSDGGCSAIVVCDDGDENEIVRQKITYTNFPLDLGIKLYIQNCILCLASES
jgi:mevalonate pyrophosphate decarboxylase